MKKIVVLFVALSTAAPSAALARRPGGLTGSWALTRAGGETLPLTFEAKGRRVIARTKGGEVAFEGGSRSEGQHTIVWFTKVTRGHSAVYAGHMSGDSVTGTVYDTRGRSEPFTMVRANDYERDPIRRAWRGLVASSNGCSRGYDYFPNGGMRSFWCHLKTLVSYETVQKLSGKPVFTAGPHNRRRLDLNSDREFGRYNPDFLRWALQVAIPAIDDPKFRRATQPVYDRTMRDLARLYKSTHLMLTANPKHYREMAASYTSYRAHRPPRPFMQGLQNKFPNLARPAHAFWVRRKLDGTSDYFAKGVTQLMQTYDADELRHLESRNWKIGTQPDLQEPPVGAVVAPGHPCDPRAKHSDGTCHFEMVVTKGHRIKGHNELGITNGVPFEECKRRCLIDDRCKSADWMKMKGGRCHLSTSSKDTKRLSRHRPSTYMHKRDLRVAEAPPTKTCQEVLIAKGHNAVHLRHCKGAEPRCAVHVLEAGHHPFHIDNCKRGLAPKCVQALLAKGHSPTHLRNCRKVDDSCAVALLERGDHPMKLSNCR